MNNDFQDGNQDENQDENQELGTELAESDEQNIDAPQEVENDDVEDVVTVGDEEQEEEEEERTEPAPEWVRQLRKDQRAAKQRIKQLEAEIQAAQQPTQVDKPLVLGAKPKLEDFDYDDAAYSTELDGWYARKQALEFEQIRAEAEKKKELEVHQQKLAVYEEQKAKLKVRDYEEAEAVILEHFNQAQQSIILNGADNPALLVYAIGKSEKKAKELANITDLAKFTFQVAKMENQVKVTQKRIPEPEKVVGSGGAAIIKNQNSVLEKLQAEALRTGDRTKVVAYKRQMREKG